MEAADFYISEEQRWSDDCAWNAALRGAESAKRRSRKSATGVLHIAIDTRVVADTEHVPQRSQREPVNSSSAH